MPSAAGRRLFSCFDATEPNTFRRFRSRTQAVMSRVAAMDQVALVNAIEQDEHKTSFGGRLFEAVRNRFRCGWRPDRTFEPYWRRNRGRIGPWDRV